MVWDEVFFKLRVSFDGMVSRKKEFLESIHHMENFYMFVEVIEVHSNVAFELCLDKVFIELWSADIMFESPHATNFHRISILK